MAENLASYLSKVQQKVDDTSTGAASVLTQFIKERYQVILSEVKQYLVTSVTNDRVVTPGTAVYTPSEFQEIALNYLPENGSFFIPLREITQDDYLKNYINESDGNPHSYFIDNGSYRLIPAPSDAGTVRETMQAVQGDVNGSSAIPDRFTYVLLDGVTSDFKAWENNLSAADVYEGKYNVGLRKMTLELSTRTKQARAKLFGRN